MTQATIETVKPGMVLTSARNTNEHWPMGKKIIFLKIVNHNVHYVLYDDLHATGTFHALGIPDFDIAETDNQQNSAMPNMATLETVRPGTVLRSVRNTNDYWYYGKEITITSIEKNWVYFVDNRTHEKQNMSVHGLKDFDVISVTAIRSAIEFATINLQKLEKEYTTAKQNLDTLLCAEQIMLGLK